MNHSADDKTFKHYLSFWIGQLFSLLGSSIVQFAVIWWIEITYKNVVYLSLAAFFSTIPMVIITPFAGVIIDRVNRKYLIAIADSAQAFITFILILLFFFNAAQIWPVIIINAFRGVCQAFHYPSVNAIIPLMIPKKHLSRMNGINYLFTGLVNTFGPIISGSLLSLFSIVQIMWADIITFFIAITPLILIKIPPIIQRLDEKSSFMRDFKFGLSVLKAIPVLLILFIFISIINLLNSPFNTLMPYFINVIHNGNPFDLALVMAIIQIGMVIGATFASVKRHWKHKEQIIVRGVLVGIGGSFREFYNDGNWGFIPCINGTHNQYYVFNPHSNQNPR
jgi:DHA3 family macrolide efflux protein-like MFS transporter